jgi:3D (Asp-Asp-Asp) domain-containing protein
MRALLCVLAACAGCKERTPPPRDAPPVKPPGALRGTFALTYYWVSVEADEPGPANTKIYDRACAAIATVSSDFAKELSIAGTGRLADGRTLTVHGECACPRSPCFRVLDGNVAWGIGAENRPLVPFRSLAVDRAVIPIGTQLYMPELAGATLPGFFPTLHDGCVVADDTGGRIDGTRIDWFVGLRADYRELDAALHLKNVQLHDGGELCGE